MEIILGKTAGFCAGVKQAVENATKELEKENKVIYALGELVHNKQVIEELEKKGLKTIENIEDAKEKVIIRAHGISKEIYEKAKKLNIEIKDFTCKKVLQIHEIAEEYAKNGYYIFLVGVENHPETLGTISFCGENSSIITDIYDVEKAIENLYKSKLEKLYIISQTTYSSKKFDEIVEKIEKTVKNSIKIEVNKTICLATELRQKETEEISKKVDCMIIIGGKNSSNTKKLYEISQKNCKNVFFAETADDLEMEIIKKFSKIGIMAGASTPKFSIDNIIDKLNIEK